MVKKIIGKAYIYLALLFMYFPILVIIAFSFTVSEQVGKWEGFDLSLYLRLFQHEKLMNAVANTILIALISSVVSVILGTVGAIGAFYSGKKTKKAIEVVTQIPVVNAEIVIALSLTVMFVFLAQKVFFVDSIFSFWTLLIGHIVLSVPFVYLSVKPKLQQMDPSIYEAALDLGATPRQALMKVTFPQILPGILSGFLLSITISLDDFIVTAFTRGPGLHFLNGENNIETLSTYIQAIIKRDNVPPETRALTTLIFLLVLSIVIGVSIYQNKKEKSSIKKFRRGRA